MDSPSQQPATSSALGPDIPLQFRSEVASRRQTPVSVLNWKYSPPSTSLSDCRYCRQASAESTF